jgi:hypothetical protein
MYTVNSVNNKESKIIMNDIINNAKQNCEETYQAVARHHQHLEAVHEAYKAAAVNVRAAHLAYDAIEKAHDEAIAEQRRLINKAKEANSYAAHLLGM